MCDGETWEIISNVAKDLINKMLIYSPENRISTEDVLKHGLKNL